MAGIDLDYVNGLFINLYSEDNPILSIDDECFFLFTNVIDVHRPLIGRGKIHSDMFSDGLNKIYFIELLEIIESPFIIKKFINDKIFLLTPIDSENLKYQKQQILNSQNISKDFLSKNLFKIEASFVRNTLEKISDLRKMYVSIIKRDFQSQIKDINEILNIIE